MPGLPAQWRAARSNATGARHFIASSCKLRWHGRQDYGVQIRMTTVRLSSLHSLLAFNSGIATVKACVCSPVHDVYTGCVRLIRDILTTSALRVATQGATMFISAVNLITNISRFALSMENKCQPWTKGISRFREIDGKLDNSRIRDRRLLINKKEWKLRRLNAKHFRRSWAC